MELHTTGPIDRTPGTPGSDKKSNNKQAAGVAGVGKQAKSGHSILSNWGSACQLSAAAASHSFILKVFKTQTQN